MTTSLIMDALILDVAGRWTTKKIITAERYINHLIKDEKTKANKQLS